MRIRSVLPAIGVVSLLATAHASAEPFVVACAPGQRAVVRQTFVRGEPVTRVECAGSVYRYAGYRRRDVARRQRSWGKTALVIGGSAASGAGIGGIIHGKKGALIGSALGAGAASLYESTRRR